MTQAFSLFLCGVFLFLRMTSASSARKSGFVSVEINHGAIGFVYESVCGPCVVILLAELDSYEI